MLLAGDIGGTKTRLTAFELVDGRLRTVVDQTFRSLDYPSLDALVLPFVAAHGLRLDGAGFGVAGPVKQGRVVATNLPWVVDAAQLASELKLPAVSLLNDLEAIAAGITALDEDDFAVLNPGTPDPDGNAVVIAAGTGLGEAGLFWDGQRHRPFASEGGHTDFAPRNELEIALLTYLIDRFGRVSYERVVSGPGLHNIYEFLRDTGRGEEPPWLRQELAEHDPAAAISQAALACRSPLCAAALDLFVSLYGAEAGNLALKVMATGGVYVAGGIAPKILDKLRDGTFLTAFTAKGRLSPLLQATPLKIVLNDRVALLGSVQVVLVAGAGRAAPGV
jgi:glucokinase